MVPSQPPVNPIFGGATKPMLSPPHLLEPGHLQTGCGSVQCGSGREGASSPRVFITNNPRTVLTVLTAADYGSCGTDR